MIWYPIAATVAVGNTATLFNEDGKSGVARVVNVSIDTLATFTIGKAGVSNSVAIPLSPGQDIVVKYEATDTHIIANSASLLRVTPGNCVWQ